MEQKVVKNGANFIQDTNNGFGITKIHLLKIEWWFSHSYIVIFEKRKKSIITVEPKRIFCDICNGRCKRGMAGNSPNICPNLNI